MRRRLAYRGGVVYFDLEEKDLDLKERMELMQLPYARGVTIVAAVGLTPRMS